MGQTLSEKIISRHAGKRVKAGDLVIVPVDGAMATDTTAPLAIQAFRQMGGRALWDPAKVALILDHATPAPNERIANLHQMMRQFADEMGSHFYDVGAGICHQLMVENDHIRPGDIFIGADSHTTTCGALGAMAMGMGSTDVAGVWLTGQTWLKVPESIKIELVGELPAGLTSKDIILHLVRKSGLAGAAYAAIELTGPTIKGLSLASRMTLANMCAEMGAKAGIVDLAGLELPYDYDHLQADPTAIYQQTIQFDVSSLRHQVAIPHSPDNVVDIDKVVGQRVDMAFIGSCTNARLEDFQAAARILKGRSIARHVRLIMAPASREVFKAALDDGTISTLLEAGATFITSGCGPCVGTHQGVPGDGETIISSTNRNFRGRMGNPEANIFLASPAVVAAAAVAGEIIDPADLDGVV